MHSGSPGTSLSRLPQSVGGGRGPGFPGRGKGHNSTLGWGMVPCGPCTGFQAPTALWAPTSATPCGPGHAGQSPDPAGPASLPRAAETLMVSMGS